jgi:hypothetical protein
MKFDELKLKDGVQLQLQASADGGELHKYGSRYIGAIAGKSLIVAMPRTPMGAPRLRPGQKVAVRIMLANGICVFACTIDHLVPSPYPMLHLSYPNNVGFKEVRGSTRVSVDHPVSVTNVSDLDEPFSEGIVADISITGARLELAQAIGGVGDQIEVLADVSVGRLMKTMRVKAVIRSRIERSTKELDHNLPAVYGIEFVEDDEDVLLVLYGYVYSEMANNDLPGSGAV